MDSMDREAVARSLPRWLVLSLEGGESRAGIGSVVAANPDNAVKRRPTTVPLGARSAPQSADLDVPESKSKTVATKTIKAQRIGE